jgi:glycosyltransferase involved in cell wall biosynthesis
MPPLVSVIIPTRERVALLRETVESALAQTFDQIEVLVVEDGSNTAATALRGYDHRVRYLRQEHHGVSVARNNGVRHASGEWLAFLDDDDLWDPTKVERQVGLASRQPDLAMIHTDHLLLVDGALRPAPRLLPRGQVPSGSVSQSLFLLDNFIVLSSVLLRREVFDRLGGFSPRFSIAADYDLWLRVSRQHRIAFLDEPLTIYREHPSMSSAADRATQESAEVLREFTSANPSIWKECGSRLVRHRLSKAYQQAGYAAFLLGDYVAARRLYFRALRWRPLRVTPLAYGLACMTGSTGIGVVRTVRRWLHRKGRPPTTRRTDG